MCAPGWNVGSTPVIGASSKAATPAAAAHLRCTCTRSAGWRPAGASGTSARCSGTCWRTGTIGSGAGSEAASASIATRSWSSSVAWCRQTANCSPSGGASASTPRITQRAESTGCTKNTTVDCESPARASLAWGSPDCESPACESPARASPARASPAWASPAWAVSVTE